MRRTVHNADDVYGTNLWRQIGYDLWHEGLQQEIPGSLGVEGGGGAKITARESINTPAQICVHFLGWWSLPSSPCIYMASEGWSFPVFAMLIGLPQGGCGSCYAPNAAVVGAPKYRSLPLTSHMSRIPHLGMA
jgi:hypothetical protein